MCLCRHMRTRGPLCKSTCSPFAIIMLTLSCEEFQFVNTVLYYRQFCINWLKNKIIKAVLYRKVKHVTLLISIRNIRGHVV
jgi:hypothetical protein